MKPEIQANKIVILSGSGISAESGIPTFRDANGLWHNYSWETVASPSGWRAHPEVVLEFYNERRLQAAGCRPLRRNPMPHIAPLLSLSLLTKSSSLLKILMICTKERVLQTSSTYMVG